MRSGGSDLRPRGCTGSLSLLSCPRHGGASPAGSPGLLHDLQHAPALLLGDRARLGDAHEVPHTALVLLVVDLEPRALLQRLLVQTVRARRAHLDDDGLVHLVGDHGAQADLALAALLARCHRGLRLRGHDFSSFDLRPRLGLVGSSTGASITGSAASASTAGSWLSSSSSTNSGFWGFLVFWLSGSAGSTSGASVTTSIPSSRSLSTVIIPAMSS